VSRSALLACLVLLAGGCGTGSAPDVSTAASAIRSVETRGADFQLQVTEMATGGDIPKGKYSEVIYASHGQVRDDNATLFLGTVDVATRHATDSFDLVVNDSNVFVRPIGSTRDWYTSWTYVAEEFIPGVRLNLVRESALLATKITRSTSFASGNFIDQYVITPAPDQLGQLMSFSSSGTLTVSVGTKSGQLQKIAGHFAGDDTTTKRHLVVDSTMTLTNVGHAVTPRVPAGGVAVQPADLFATSLPGS
jgi:hypothetical protein